MAKVTAKAKKPERRQPSQARGQQRVEMILQTAERLFASEGFERVSTNQIAETAEIPVGSIYQYFKNKDAILLALVDRYRGAFAQQLIDIAADLQSMSIATLVDQLIDTSVAFGHAHESFSLLLLQAQPGTPLEAADLQLQSGMFSLIESVIRARAPWISREDSAAYAAIAQTLQRATIVRVLTESRNGNVAFAQRLVEESKRMQVAYFEKLLTDGGQ